MFNYLNVDNIDNIESLIEFGSKNNIISPTTIRELISLNNKYDNYKDIFNNMSFESFVNCIIIAAKFCGGVDFKNYCEKDSNGNLLYMTDLSKRIFIDDMAIALSQDEKLSKRLYN